MKRIALFASALVCLHAFSHAVAQTNGASADSKAPRPHILVILADDLGFVDTGFQGGDIRTPNLDRLAAGGVRLDQFYVQPVCTPTRSSLMTGRYPMRYGLQVGVILAFHDHGLPVEERTIAQVLKGVGYRTVMTGKWHLGLESRANLPTHRGFDHHYGHYLGQIDYFTHESKYGGLDWHRNEQPVREEGYSTTLIADEAVRLIEEHDPNQPLFCYVPFNAPHTPLQVPERYLEEYKKVEPENRRIFSAMVTCMDEAVGRIVAALDRKGMRDNTLILFSSDNGGAEYGGAENGPLRGAKGDLHEGGVRVPALAVWPGKLKAGTVVREPLHIVDWYPTLARLAGADLAGNLPLDGKDAWPTLAEGKPSPHEEILHNVEPGRGAIRRGDWKLVLNGGHRRRASLDESEMELELFNIADDPYEKTDLSDRHPERVKALRARLDEYAEQAATPLRGPSNRRPKDFKAPALWGPPPPSK